MTGVDFFPYASDKYEVKGETERLPDADGKIRIRKLVSKSGADWPARINGVLVSKAAGDGAPQGYEVNLTLALLSAAVPGATTRGTCGCVFDCDAGFCVSRRVDIEHHAVRVAGDSVEGARVREPDP